MYKNNNIKINNTDRGKGDCKYTLHKSQHSVHHLLVLEDGAGQKPKQSRWFDFQTVNCCVLSSHPLPGMLCPSRQESCLRGKVHLPVDPLQHWVLRSLPCTLSSGLVWGSACLHSARAMTAWVCLARELEDLNMGSQCLTAYPQVLLTCQDCLTLASLSVLFFNVGKINISTLKVAMRTNGN